MHDFLIYMGHHGLFYINLIFAMVCGAMLNRARGAGLVKRQGWSFVIAWVMTQGFVWPLTPIIGCLIWLAWFKGWGAYLGQIVAPGVYIREVEDNIITDRIVRTKWVMKLPDRAWGTVATSIRFGAWTIPLFLYLQNPLWPLMLLAGPLYLMGTYIDESMDEKDPTTRNQESGWGLGEYLIGAWLVFLLLIWGGQA